MAQGRQTLMKTSYKIHLEKSAACTWAREIQNQQNDLCIQRRRYVIMTWQNQQNECAPSEDSAQPGHPPSLIRVFAVCMKKAWVLSYPLSTQRRHWSDWMDAQADLSLRWVHSHSVGFVISRLMCPWLPREVKTDQTGQSWLKAVTVMILSFRTDMPGQTVQTQIRLLLQEQSDQGPGLQKFWNPNRSARPMTS